MDFFTQNQSVAFWSHFILTYVITNICTKFHNNASNTFDAVQELFNKM